MITEETARKQLEMLHQEGSVLAEEFRAEQKQRRKLYGRRKSKAQLQVVIVKFAEEGKKKEEPKAPKPPPPEKTRFEERYQSWYSRALPLMKQLALDRYAEFQSFYVVDPRYPRGKTSVYVIQDYLRDPGSDDAGKETVRCFRNQLTILKSVADRLAWTALDTEDQLSRSLQLSLLETARGLIKVNERAAGTVAAMVLETYLKKLAAKHQISLRKQSPTINELAEALKAANVITLPTWSQLTWLAEMRERCWKEEGATVTKPQAKDLIDGTHWWITNVF